MLFHDEILDEDEMFCVFSELNRKNPPFPYWNYDRIEKQMDDMSSAEIKSEFRFGHSELPLLAEALQIPQYFVCSNRTVASGMEGLLILLKRFAYPCRLSDMIPRFGRSVQEISLILAEVTDHIYRTNGHLLVVSWCCGSPNDVPFSVLSTFTNTNFGKRMQNLSVCQYRQIH